MSTNKSIADVIKKTQYWLRLSTFLHEPLRDSLLRILHNTSNDPNYVGLPKDPTDLYQEIQTNHQAKINQLKQNRILQQDQIDLISPPGDNKTFSETFDVTLIVVLIRNCTTLLAPLNGWGDKNPPVHDVSIAANCIRGREWRNYVHHTDPKKIDQAILNQKWNEGCQIVNSLGYVYDTNRLKNISLDPKHDLVLKSLFNYLDQQGNRIDQQDDSIDQQDDRIDQQGDRIDQQGNHIDQQDDRNNQQDDRIDQQDDRIDQQGDRIDQQDDRIDQQDDRIDQQDDHIDQQDDHIDQQDDHIDQQDDRIDQQDDRIDQQGDRIDQQDDRIDKILQEQEETIEMRKQLETISEQVEHLQNPQINIQNETDMAKVCLKEVLEYIADEIGEQWLDLLNMFQISSEVREELTTNARQPSQNVKQFFESSNWLIIWNQLKKYLEALGRTDIVEQIETNTLITQGLSIASAKLKNYYITKLINYLVEQPLATEDNTNHYIPREENYIDLAVLTAATVDKEWNNSDRDALIKQQYLQKSSLTVNDIFQQDDEVVMVRGVAGIGKSTFINMYTLKWAKEELLNGNDEKPKIDFLFMFTCREINTLENLTSIEELFRLNYLEIFKYIAFEDLHKVAARVMIVIDGLDELQNIYSTKTAVADRSFYLKIIKDMIKTKESVLTGHKSLICGRPKAMEMFKSDLITTHKIKTVEVCGFNSKNVLKYISVFFQHNREKAEWVQKIVKESNNLAAMASVPVFLWVICNVYSEDLITESIDTNTKLYLYGCLVFLRNHLRGIGNSQYKCLADLVQDQMICEVILVLAKLSTKTYMNHQVVFSEEDIKSLSCPIHLEQTGFIVKHSCGELRRSMYQFKHLVLQEFLCSLYLCLTKDIRSFQTNREFSSCTPTILGIHRILKDQGNNLFTDLFKNLFDLNSSNLTVFKSILGKFSYKKFIKKITNLEKAVLKLIEHNALDINPDNILLTEYMVNVFEMKYQFSHEVLQKMEKVRIMVILHSRVDIRNALYLVKALRVNNFYILISFDELSPDILELFELASIGKNRSFEIDNVKHSKTRSLLFSNPCEFCLEFDDGTARLYIKMRVLTPTMSEKTMSVIGALKVKRISGMDIAFSRAPNTFLKLLELASNSFQMEWHTRINFSSFTPVDDRINTLSAHKSLDTTRKSLEAKFFIDSNKNEDRTQMISHLKQFSNKFSIGGPSKDHQMEFDLSHEQEIILLDLANHVIDNHSTKRMHVYEFSYCLNDNWRREEAKSKLLEKEFGENELFRECITITLKQIVL